jgi:hypothetical protein
VNRELSRTKEDTTFLYVGIDCGPTGDVQKAERPLFKQFTGFCIRKRRFGGVSRNVTGMGVL